MTHGSIIGYDINAKMCQISYYNEKTQEPETVDTGIEKENNQIPLVMNYYKETWTYGRQARRMSTVGTVSAWKGSGSVRLAIEKLR